ncbi:hypothetical protein GCM10007036_11640 [Alsobacter metallidurans]|uniref:DUF707 domain-containing protein n=1 Tax=Alsobacter metallidurans TaxID=340221 RepID=A0A917I544_9HYPH|nr:DUF707 domain-containing protein [Alsobacter metallidurans]GGH13219.1 hypothetical protein GCM10007036_11640 [Alsobacter metallidurans]
MANPSNKKFLVIGRVGDKSLHKHWLEPASTERNWDLVLNSYGKDQTRVQDGDLPTVFDPGTKWDSIVRQFKAHPELLEQYTHVMLPDDDLLMTAGDINRMFEVVVENGLTMAQPSLTYESYISWPILLHVPGFKLRYCNFLESMACVIDVRYLKSLLPMFEKHYTGWGTDMIWTMLMRDPPFRAAIIDEVQMTHTRPLYSGPIYNTFVDMHVDPRDEVRKLTESFANYPNSIVTYGGVLANGRTVGGRRTMLANVSYLVRNAHRSRLWSSCLVTASELLARSITMNNYRPEQLKPVAGSAFDRLGITAADLQFDREPRPSEISLPERLAI